MSRRRVTLLAAALAAVLALPAAAAANDATRPYVVLLSPTSDANDHTRALERAGGFTSTFRYESAIDGFAADLSPRQVARLNAHPSVRSVEHDTVVRAAGKKAAPAPQPETVPPGVERINAASAAASDAAVAVIDSGIDLDNPDLNAVSGVNCVKRTGPAQDHMGHGTHVAGIIGARRDGSSAVGVAPGTRLVAVKVLDRRGRGSLSELLCGINWVAAHARELGIRVANLSLGTPSRGGTSCAATAGDAQHAAVCAVLDAGVTVVAGAGNGATDLESNAPAAYPEVLAATAMTDTDGVAGGAGPGADCTPGAADDTAAGYSNHAVRPEAEAHTIAAPGTCVVSSAIGGGLATYYGTSQAAPHVAGAVALCIGHGGRPGPCANLTPAETIARLRRDAEGRERDGTGFLGDPAHPLAGRLFGPLVDAAGY